MAKRVPVVQTSKTKLKPIRIPLELLNLVEGAANQSAELIELMMIGAKQKYGEDFELSMVTK